MTLLLGCKSADSYLLYVVGDYTRSNQIICKKNKQMSMGKLDRFLLLHIKISSKVFQYCARESNHNDFLLLFVYLQLIVNLNLPHLRATIRYYSIILLKITTHTGVQDVKVSNLLALSFRLKTLN